MIISIIICVPGVIMRDKPETEADFGTLPDVDLGFSGVSSWWAMRRDAPLRNDGLVPVLLLRRRIRRRLETIPSRIREAKSEITGLSQMLNYKRGECKEVRVCQSHPPPRQRWQSEA